MRFIKRSFSILSVVLSIGLFSYVVLYTYVQTQPSIKVPLINDFNFYYYSFEIIWHNKNPFLLYDSSNLLNWLYPKGTQDPKTYLGFFGYPPHFSVLFSWMSIWNIEIAKKIWFYLNNFLFILGSFLFVPIAYKGKRLDIRLLMVSLPLIIAGFINDSNLGQINRLLFFLLSLTFFLFFVKRKPWLAGIPLSIAIVFKILPVIIFFFLFLLRKEWKVCLSTVFSTGFLTLLTAKVVGFPIIFDYFINHLHKLNQINMQHGGAPWNSSLHGVLQSFGIPYPLADKQFFLIVIFFTFSLSLFFLMKRGDIRGDISLAVIAMLFIPPVLESHYILYINFILLSLFGKLIDKVQPENIKANYKKQGIIGIIFLFIQLGIISYTIKLTLVPPKGISYFVALLLLLFLSLGMYEEKGLKTT